eukprot:c7205_g1_i1.p1 GENE.c7205_g1_i1~~c7205_g1_i1.p1  ORF type:complete len:1235 (+),score=392.99 c7205_g1_i1:55-3705(+)
MGIGTDPTQCVINGPLFKVSMDKPANHFEESFQKEDWFAAFTPDIRSNLHAIEIDEKDLQITNPSWNGIIAPHGIAWTFLSARPGVPENLRTLKFFIVSQEPVTPDRPVSTRKRILNTFQKDIEECKDPLPLTIRAEDNSEITCLRIAMFPDLCERAFGVQLGEEGQSQEYVVEITHKVNDECDHSSAQRFDLLFTGNMLGDDEEDRTWHTIIDIKSQSIFSNPNLGMFEWAFRTTKDYHFQLSYTTALAPPVTKTVEISNEPIDNSEIEAMQARASKFISTMQPEDETNPKVGMDLGRILDEPDTTAADGGDASAPKKPVVVEWQVPAETCSILDEGFPKRIFGMKQGWVQLTESSRTTTSAEEGPLCIRMKRTMPTISRKIKFHQRLCDMVKEIKAQNDDSMDGISHAVYIQLEHLDADSIVQFNNFVATDPSNKSFRPLPKHLELMDKAEMVKLCEFKMNRTDAATFMLVFKSQVDAGGWRMGMTLLEGRVGTVGSWRWMVDDNGDLMIRFEIASKTQVFQSSVCRNRANDLFPNDLVAANTNQQFQCMRIHGKSENNCKVALGLSETNSIVSFEASLATQIETTDKKTECLYMQPFVMSFTDKPHYITESSTATSDRIPKSDECSVPEAHQIIISGAHIEMPEQWRWSSDENGRLQIVFPTIVTWDGQPKRVWEKFKSFDPSRTETSAGSCPVKLNPSFPPPEMFDEETLRNPPFDMKITNWWDTETSDEFNQDGINHVYKCLKLVRLSGDPPVASTAETAAYRQAIVAELARDMAIDPKLAKGESQHGSVAALMGQFHDYSDLKQAIKENLGASTYRNAVTRETGTEYENFAAGYLSHFGMLDQVPPGHPRITNGKIVHSQGMIGKCEFVSSLSNPYSGLLGKPRVPLIARFSSATPSDFIPGWAFKFFRDAPAPNSDLLVYNSFYAQKTCEVLKYKVSNFPEWNPSDPNRPMNGMHNAMQLLLQRGQALRREYNSTDVGTKFPMRLGISHLFLDDAKATELRLRHNEQPLQKTIPKKLLEGVTYPDQLILVPHPGTAKIARDAGHFSDTTDSSQACSDHQSDLIAQQLSAIPARSPLFDVFAVSSASMVSSPQEYVPAADDHIGTIYLEERMFPSWFGDTMLHFKHEIYESDIEGSTDHAKSWEVLRTLYSEPDSFTDPKLRKSELPPPVASKKKNSSNGPKKAAATAKRVINNAQVQLQGQNQEYSETE